MTRRPTDGDLAESWKGISKTVSPDNRPQTAAAADELADGVLEVVLRVTVAQIDREEVGTAILELLEHGFPAVHHQGHVRPELLVDDHGFDSGTSGLIRSFAVPSHGEKSDRSTMACTLRCPPPSITMTASGGPASHRQGGRQVELEAVGLQEDAADDLARDLVTKLAEPSRARCRCE